MTSADRLWMAVQAGVEHSVPSQADTAPVHAAGSCGSPNTIRSLRRSIKKIQSLSP